MKFPIFWFEGNLFFNLIQSFDDLKRLFDTYKGEESIDSILDKTRNKSDSSVPYYGFGTDCDGTISLREFFYENGVVINENNNTDISFVYGNKTTNDFEVLGINEKIEVDNYPYGGKRTKAYFSVEYGGYNRGYRTVFQTINPKTGSLNKESKSTYGDIYIILKEKENGHYKYKHLSLNGDESIEKSLCFIWNNYEKLMLDNNAHDFIFNRITASRMISHVYTDYKSVEFKEQFKKEYLNPFTKQCSDLAKNPTKEGYYKLAVSLNKIKNLSHN
jgi:hypothetical protein